jgi:hypothetical protein
MESELIEELKRCQIDMFEAVDKFHVLSFYISDPQAKQCAESRVAWFRESNDRIQKLLKSWKEQKNDQNCVQ